MIDKRKSSRNGSQVVEDVIDITSSLSNVIGETEDRELIKVRLLEYVKGVVACV